MLGVDVEHDSFQSGGLFLKEFFVIFIDVAPFGDPLVQFGRPALKDEILHLAVRCARPRESHWSLTIPDISYGASVQGFRKLGEYYVDLSGLFICFSFPNVSVFRKFGGFPPPGKVGIVADVEGYFLSQPEIIINTQHMEKIVPILPPYGNL